jgi:tetratricopeptide (TPR) repeat protein
MSVLSQLLGHLKRRVSGRRNHTALEVRELIQKGDFTAAAAAAEALFPDTPDLDLVRHCLRGEIAFRQHHDEAAEAHFRQALSQAPGWPGAHYGLSLVKLARRELDEALRHALFASTHGRDAHLAAQLGLCQLLALNHGAAAEALERATRLDATDGSSWNNLGIARRANGDATGAREAFRRALEIDPHFDRARYNLAQVETEVGAAQAPAPDAAWSTADAATAAPRDDALTPIRRLAEQGEGAQALEAAERFCMNHPDDGAAAVLLADLHTERGDAQSGLDVLRIFLARHPTHFEVRRAFALTMVRERIYKPAFALLTTLLQERPDDEALLIGMATIQTDRSEIAAAGELFERIYALNPTLDNKGRLASSCAARCEYERVLTLTDEMVAEDPDCEGKVLGMRVDALTNLGLHDEALPLLDAAIAINPRDAARRFLRSSIHLLNGRFGEGWDDYAMRLIGMAGHLRTLALPEWKGEPLEGKRIVVLSEQGLGDLVMFASCLPDLLGLKPARVVVEAVDRLAPTLARSFPQCEVVASKQDAAMAWLRDVGELDCYVAIADLPRRFRRKAADFPSRAGYLVADPQRVDHWRQVLSGLGRRPIIGVSWRGGTQTTRSVLRTMKVTDLLSVFGAIDANWVCLQYGDVHADVQEARSVGVDLHHWPEAIEDLDEFAALISALSLVITVCNTTVHYAGALAKPVWVMAPRIPEWRYGLHFRALPWYPTSVMYRQTSDRDWGDVLGTIRRDLVTHFDWSIAIRATSSQTEAAN